MNARMHPADMAAAGQPNEPGHTPVSEVGFRTRSVLFDGPWIRAVYSVARYRSAWGVHRVTNNPRDPMAGEWAVWTVTGIKTKAEAVAEARLQVARTTGSAA